MIIDRETFTEVSLHLQLARDTVSRTAGHVAVLSNGDGGSEEHWVRLLDELMAMTIEMTALEEIFGAVAEANREEASSLGPPPSRKNLHPPWS